jgi:hypothetical protein
MPSEIELQHRSETADACLGVAEELGWAAALFAGLGAFAKWESYLLAIAADSLVYWLGTLRYRRQAAAAQDEYHRAARLGKYVPPHRP